MFKNVVALACLLLLSAFSAPAAAQGWRDAGAKLRGEFDRPRTTAPVYRAYQPEYRVFAYEPSDLRRGDEVVVTTAAARLMRGASVLGQVPYGRSLEVIEVRGPWVGIAAEVDGRQLAGWIWAGNLVAKERFDERAAARPAPRAYSYEPYPPGIGYRRSAVGRGDSYLRADSKLRGEFGR